MQEKPKPPHLTLHVRYISAARPYIDPKADPAQTLDQLLPTVLDFFSLQVNADKTYFFALDGERIRDNAQTLATLAAGKHELKLHLSEQFEQGGRVLRV